MTNLLQGLPSRNKTYISAYSPHSVTLSGPPTSLKLVTTQLTSECAKLQPCDLPIRVPFHAEHLFSSEVMHDILDVPSIGRTYSDQRLTAERGALISGSDGSLRQSQEGSALLKTALQHILIQPVHWESMCRGCHEVILSSQSLKWTLRPFGVTRSLESLVAYLNKDITRKVSLDDSFSKGMFMQSKSARAPLAIVGMAGRFPGSTNHDALWELLMEGQDCHTKVCHRTETKFAC